MSAFAQAKQLAIGRIMRMASRPSQPGDVAEYERCRAIIMADSPEFLDERPNWARDRMKGAAGDLAAFLSRFPE